MNHSNDDGVPPESDSVIPRIYGRVRRLPLFKQNVVFETSLPSDIVRHRLAESLRTGSFVGWLSAKQGGWVQGADFTIKTRSWLSNNSAFSFNGVIEPTSTGSLLVGSVGPIALLPLMMAFMFLFCLSMEVILIFSALNSGPSMHAIHPAALLFPPGFFLWGVFVMTMWVKSERRRWSATEEWLIGLLDASKL